MKKYFIASFAVIAAFASFAFVKQTGTETGPSCTSQLYYFNTTATACNLVSTTNVQPRVDIGVDGNPLTVATEVEFKTPRQNPYGCQSTIQTPCAVGYTFEQIETFVDPADGVQKWRPIASQIGSYGCCVKLVRL